MGLTLTKPFQSFFISTIFIFSTIWGLYYYWSLGESHSTQMEGLSDNPNDPKGLGLVGTISGILDFLSWINPFGLVKGIIFLISPPEIYEFINIFLLRPIGWIGTMITVNYLISKIPTVSGE